MHSEEDDYNRDSYKQFYKLVRHLSLLYELSFIKTQDISTINQEKQNKIDELKKKFPPSKFSDQKLLDFAEQYNIIKQTKLFLNQRKEKKKDRQLLSLSIIISSRIIQLSDNLYFQILQSENFRQQISDFVSLLQKYSELSSLNQNQSMHKSINEIKQLQIIVVIHSDKKLQNKHEKKFKNLLENFRTEFQKFVHGNPQQ